MGLPPYFHSTTLRTLLAEGGPQDEGPVYQVAKRAHIDLIVGSDAQAEYAGETFVELAARTIGSISIQSDNPELERNLQLRARAINPRIAESPARESSVVVVSLNGEAGVDAEVHAWGRGWWAGWSDPGPAHPDSPTLGAIAAGALAFNAAFMKVFGSVLPTPPEIPDVPGWSLRDVVARAANSLDLEPVDRVRLPHAALVGCGAIGQAVAYSLGRSRVAGGPLDLIDPQTISTTNLQRYIGSRPKDAVNHAHKVVLAASALKGSGLAAQMYAGKDWADYRGVERDVPRLVVTALDTASARRMVQAALPQWVVNGWTRTSECGVTMHDFGGPDQCLVCTYLPRDVATPTNDYSQLISELGIPPIRVIQLLAGGSLSPADLRFVERHRQLPGDSLNRWQGESVRSLYGELCGVVHVRLSDRSDYVVPLPQASVLSGVLVVAQTFRLLTGLAEGTRPIEVALLPKPGPIWQMPSARKDQHPVRCICKDAAYVARYEEKWATRPALVRTIDNAGPVA
jgi:molybdopterin/thiamine biosynthesis adenylyltransferase